MARLSLNKTALHREQSRLRQFQRLLLSLDLKRRQLIAERRRARETVQASEAELDALVARVRERLPMAGDDTLKIENLAQVTAVRLREHNLLGVHLPMLEGIDIDLADYPALTTPHWLDRYREVLRDALALTVRLQVEWERLHRLERAVRRVTQRVNLFDKVLIPRTREHIRRIRIHLADGERSAVVRAKLAKRKQAQGARR
ncbi:MULTISPECIES: V-type ATP synthase subunit D [Halomonadaceae]|uniref:V/A-type H+-transporting ATPase subunit D n=3 Tax=Halomonadaceae TaxID=28256 RepID=A0A1I3ENK5_9GAMM|nr:MULTISPECIES: V-type ATP synthase subunit D [Halomonas]AJY53105.1 V-type ATPase, D subunit [Halomonas sp. KO116]NYS79137.1 V-type ATP synthase subunit D [Halomonas glaciei]SFI00575.1 V/A-type H+-transporting ATPase subunit D [Halomonas xianhensis]